MAKKHISFDLWGTLIKSNPLYKPLRTKLFEEVFIAPLNKYHRAHLNTTGFNLEKWIRKVERFCDFSNETLGNQITFEQVVVMCAMELEEYYSRDFFLRRMKDFEQQHQRLVENHPPIMYCNKTYGVLEKLHYDGIDMSILSNTSFIKGSLLRQVLRAHGIDRFFIKQTYSDEMKLSKPSLTLFNYQLGVIGAPVEDVLHVGDNVVTDGGFSKIGVDVLIINKGNGQVKTITDVLKSVTCS